LRSKVPAKLILELQDVFPVHFDQLPSKFWLYRRGFYKVSSLEVVESLGETPTQVNVSKVGSPDL